MPPCRELALLLAQRKKISRVCDGAAAFRCSVSNRVSLTFRVPSERQDISTGYGLLYLKFSSQSLVD